MNEPLKFDIGLTGDYSLDNPQPTGINPVGVVPLGRKKEQPVDPMQEHLDSLTALTERLLNAPHGAGSLNDWQLAVSDHKVSPREFYEATGRINAGIGTGDKALKDARGDVTGYVSKEGPPMSSGSNGLTNGQWAKTFSSTGVQAKDDKGTLVQYQGMNPLRPATALCASSERMDVPSSATPSGLTKKLNVLAALRSTPEWAPAIHPTSDGLIVGGSSERSFPSHQSDEVSLFTHDCASSPETIPTFGATELIPSINLSKFGFPVPSNSGSPGLRSTYACGNPRVSYIF